jgi:L-malate glycosyltransferase
MRIAFFVHGYLPWDVYGVPRHIERLSKYLSENGHEIIIIVAGRPNLPRIEKSGNITIYRMPYIELKSKRFRSSWSILIYTVCCIFLGPKLIKKHKIDVIHGHTVKHGGFQSALVSVITGRPCFVTVHGSGLERYPSKKMPFKLHFLNRTTLIVQKMSAYKKLEGWHFNGTKVYLTEGCVDVKKFKPSTEVPKKNNVVTFVGRLTQFKGPDLLIKVAPYVLAKNNDVTFQFVGEGDLKEELMAKVDSLGLEKKIIFLGFRKDVDAIFRKSSVSLHLSPYENFTDFALLEAMCSGVPVVATNVGETSTIVKDGKTGFLVKPDPEDIADKIIKVLEDQHLAKELSENERTLIENNYCLEVFGKKHLELYTQLSGNVKKSFLFLAN